MNIEHEMNYDYVWFYWVGKGEVGRKHSLCYAFIPILSFVAPQTFCLPPFCEILHFL